MKPRLSWRSVDGHADAGRASSTAQVGDEHSSAPAGFESCRHEMSWGECIICRMCSDVGHAWWCPRRT